jgi:hypothetical protein
MLLFTKEIKNSQDILVVESKIRELLQCESCFSCSFLQSAPYKKLVNNVLLYLNGILSSEEEIRLNFGSNSMTLVMKDDMKTIEIVKKETSRSEERRRKYPKQMKQDDFVRKMMDKRLAVDPICLHD